MAQQLESFAVTPTELEGSLNGHVRSRPLRERGAAFTRHLNRDIRDEVEAGGEVVFIERTNDVPEGSSEIIDPYVGVPFIVDANGIQTATPETALTAPERPQPILPRKTGQVLWESQVSSTVRNF